MSRSVSLILVGALLLSSSGTDAWAVKIRFGGDPRPWQPQVAAALGLTAPGQIKSLKNIIFLSRLDLEAMEASGLPVSEQVEKVHQAAEEYALSEIKSLAKADFKEARNILHRMRQEMGDQGFSLLLLLAPRHGGVIAEAQSAFLTAETEQAAKNWEMKIVDWAGKRSEAVHDPGLRVERVPLQKASLELSAKPVDKAVEKLPPPRILTASLGNKAQDKPASMPASIYAARAAYLAAAPDKKPQLLAALNDLVEGDRDNIVWKNVSQEELKDGDLAQGLMETAFVEIGYDSGLAAYLQNGIIAVKTGESRIQLGKRNGRKLELIAGGEKDFDRPIGAMAAWPDGTLVVGTAGGTIQLLKWDGHQLAQIPGGELRLRDESLFSMTLGPDGSIFAKVSPTKVTFVKWDGKTLEQSPGAMILGHRISLLGVLWDGTLAVSVEDVGNILLLRQNGPKLVSVAELRLGNQVLEFVPLQNRAVAARLADGRLVPLKWDGQTLEKISGGEISLGAVPRTLVTFPDRTILVGLGNRERCRLTWDGRKFKQVPERGSSGFFYEIFFAADGDMFARTHEGLLLFTPQTFLVEGGQKVAQEQVVGPIKVFQSQKRPKPTRIPQARADYRDASPEEKPEALADLRKLLEEEKDSVSWKPIPTKDLKASDVARALVEEKSFELPEGIETARRMPDGTFAGITVEGQLRMLREKDGKLEPILGAYFREAYVQCYAVLANGTIAVGTADGDLQLLKWTGRRLEKIPGGKTALGAVAWALTGSADGTIAAGLENGEVRLVQWDSRQLVPIPGGQASLKEPVWSVAFMGHGVWAAGLSNGEVRLVRWDGEKLAPIPGASVRLVSTAEPLAVLADGTLAAVLKNGTIQFLAWDGRTLSRIRGVEIATPGGSASLAVSPDGTALIQLGRKLAITSQKTFILDDDQNATLLSGSGKIKREKIFGQVGLLQAPALPKPDTIRAAKEAYKAAMSEEQPQALADLRELVEKAKGTIRWQITPPEELKDTDIIRGLAYESEVLLESKIKSVAHLPDGLIVVGTDNGRIGLFRRNGQKLEPLPRGELSLAGSLWGVVLGGYVVNALAVLEDGTIAAGLESGEVHLVKWDGQKLKEVPEGRFVFPSAVKALTALPDGALVVGLENGEIHVVRRDGEKLETISRKQIWREAAPAVRSLGVLPDGSIVVGFRNGYVSLLKWDGSKGEMISCSGIALGKDILSLRILHGGIIAGQLFGPEVRLLKREGTSFQQIPAGQISFGPLHWSSDVLPDGGVVVGGDISLRVLAPHAFIVDGEKHVRSLGDGSRIERGRVLGPIEILKERARPKPADITQAKEVYKVALHEDKWEALDDLRELMEKEKGRYAWKARARKSLQVSDIARGLTQERMFSFPSTTAHSARLHDGTFVVATRDSKLQLWTEDGLRLAQISEGDIPFESSINAVAVLPNEIIVVALSNSKIHLVKRDGRRLKEIAGGMSVNGYIRNLAVATGGAVAVGLGKGDVVILEWDGEELKLFPNGGMHFDNSIMGLAFLSDDILAVGEGRKVRLMKPHGGKWESIPGAELPLRYSIAALVALSDRTLLAATENDEVHHLAWDGHRLTSDPDEKRSFRDPIRFLDAWSDGSVMVGPSDAVRVYSPQTFIVDDGTSASRLHDGQKLGRDQILGPVQVYEPKSKPVDIPSAQAAYKEALPEDKPGALADLFELVEKRKDMIRWQTVPDKNLKATDISRGWAPESGTSFELGSTIRSIVPLPNGAVVVITSDDKIRLWRQHQGKWEEILKTDAVFEDYRELFSDDDPILSLVVTPARTVVVGTRNGEVRLLSFNGPRLERVLRGEISFGATRWGRVSGRSGVWALGILSDGTVLAGRGNGEVHLLTWDGLAFWRIEDSELQLGGPVKAFTPLGDGAIVVGLENRKVVVLEKQDGKKSVRIRDEGLQVSGHVESLAFLGSGLVVAGLQKGGVDLLEWNGQRLKKFEGGDAFKTLQRLLVRLPDGDIVLGSREKLMFIHRQAFIIDDDKSATLLDGGLKIARGKAFGTIEILQERAADIPQVQEAYKTALPELKSGVLADLRELVDKEKDRLLWKDTLSKDLQHADIARGLVAEADTELSSEIRSSAFLEDGTIVAGTDDGNVRLLRRNGQKLVPIHGSDLFLGGPVESLAIIREGVMVAGVGNGNIWLLRREGDRLQGTPALGLVFSWPGKVSSFFPWVGSPLTAFPDGAIFAGSFGQIVPLKWDGQKVELLPEGAIQIGRVIHALAALPGGIVVALLESPLEVRLFQWDGQKLKEIPGVQAGLPVAFRSLATLPDGTIFVSSAYDGRVAVMKWDGKQLGLVLDRSVDVEGGQMSLASSAAGALAVGNKHHLQLFSPRTFVVDSGPGATLLQEGQEIARDKIFSPIQVLRLPARP